MSNTSKNPDNFAERLRSARERAGLTQQQLADLAELPPSAISHFESDRRKPSFENLRRLSDALRVTIDHLLGRSVDPSTAGAEAQVMFRGLAKLTSDDQKLIQEMIDLLKSRRSSKSENEDGEPKKGK